MKAVVKAVYNLGLFGPFMRIKKPLFFSAFFYLASFVLLTRGRAAPLDGDLSASAVVDEADAPKIAE